MADLKVVLAGAALVVGVGVAAFVLRGGAQTGLGTGGAEEVVGTGSGPGTAVDAAGPGGPAAPATTPTVLAAPSATSGPVAPSSAASDAGSGGPGTAQAGELRVRVRSTRTKQPVARATARLDLAGEGARLPASGESATLSTNPTSADEAGQIVLTPPAGTYTLTVEAAGFEPWTKASVSAGPGVACDIGYVDLAPRPALRGTVTGQRGPAASARVAVVNEVALKIGPDMNFMNLLRDMKEDERIYARTTTGPDGAFQLWYDELAPGEYALRIEAAEHAVGFASVVCKPEVTTEASITLLPPGVLAGRVIDPAGVGVAGCAVVASLNPDQRSMPKDMKWVLFRQATVTDAEGQFRFADARPGEYMLFVGGGRHPRAVQQNISAPSTEIEVRLAPGVVLVGRLTDARTGAPIAGADIGAGGDGGLDAGRTDADGRFRLDGLTVGDFEIFVQARGYPPLQKRVEPKEPGEMRVDLTLASGIVVAGTVRRTDRTPVAGARVFAFVGPGGFGMGGLPSATTDATGRFTLPGLSTEAGIGRVHVEGPGAEAASPRAQAQLVVRADGLVQRGRVSVELIPGEEPRGVEIVCDPATRVTGRVVDAAGKPVAGATVAASRPMDPRSADESMQTDFMLAWMLPETKVETGPDGAFVLASVRPGEGVQVTARRDGYVTGRSAPFAAASGGTIEGVTVALSLGGRAVVVATGPDGAPAVGVPFRLQPDAVGRPGQPAEPAEDDPTDPAEMMFGMMGQQAETDVQGRATFAGVKPGRYRLVAAEGAAHALARATTFEVAEGHETVTAVAMIAPLAIQGVVRDQDGAPVPNAWVNATPIDENISVSIGGGTNGRTDARGAFTIPRVAPGAYQLHVWANGYQPAPTPVTAAAGASGVEIRLTKSEARAAPAEAR